jgi:hypothetical protein
MMRTLLALLLLAGVLAAPAQAEAAAPREFFGVMVDGPYIDPQIGISPAREARLMRRSGVDLVRRALYFDEVQPDEGGPFQWGRYDRFVKALARQRIRFFPILHRAPLWARTGDFTDAASPPRLDAWERFVRAAVQRYGARGSFWRRNRDVPRLPVRDWQVWNEPNHDGSWNALPWATTYSPFLRFTHDVIKRTDRSADVVTAGLSGDLDDLVNELYDAGAAGAFDAIGLHAYREKVPYVLSALDEVRDVIRARRDDARMVLSEISFSSGKGQNLEYRIGIERTETGQRASLVSLLRRLVAKRRALRIDSVHWYTWMSWPIGLSSSFDYSGLRRLTNRGPVSKPALAGFRRVAR